jgi:hypothetical protein
MWREARAVALLAPGKARPQAVAPEADVVAVDTDVSALPTGLAHLFS